MQSSWRISSTSSGTPAQRRERYSRHDKLHRAGAPSQRSASPRTAMLTMSQQDIDPRPVPPVRPSGEDCCRGSCDPCIFDVYDEALDRYRADLHVGGTTGAQEEG